MVQRSDLDESCSSTVPRRALRGERVENPAGDPHRRAHRMRVTDRDDVVRRREQHAVDDDPARQVRRQRSCSPRAARRDRGTRCRRRRRPAPATPPAAGVRPAADAAPVIWIASAPASRSSSSASSRSSAATWCCGSVICRSMPGPVAGRGARQDLQGRGALLRLFQARPRSDRCRRVSFASEVCSARDLRAQLVRPRREAVEDVDKVGLPGGGETEARRAVHLSHQRRIRGARTAGRR